MSLANLVDTHCHLDSKEFDADREDAIQRALDAGVSRMVAIGTGTGPPDLEAGVRLADRHACFYATVGVHPHDAAKATDAADSDVATPKIRAFLMFIRPTLPVYARAHFLRK